ncbi:MAG TPA: Lrp/AsnC family transcriptional regulator [Gammaproteobacteria bacterium]|nr:Lrp/AsnC family transcriptional regulator [Gammaproteobacteria bacterium]
MLDELDTKALAWLGTEGRVTWATLGEELGLSAPAAADRVRRLEERGVIRGYTALVDAEAAGYPLMAFVAVTLGSLKGNFRGREEFLELIQEMDEVKECHHLAGSDDFLLKVRCRGTEDLERILIERLRSLPLVTHTRTTVVLGTTKEVPSMVSPRRGKTGEKPRAKRRA